MNIYISGSMAYDRIMDFPGSFADYILPDKIHVLNVCFNVTSLQEKFGGTAGNIAHSLRLLGEQPVIIATIGKDHGPYFPGLNRTAFPWKGSKSSRTNSLPGHT
jgi:adenosine kinase